LRMATATIASCLRMATATIASCLRMAAPSMLLPWGAKWTELAASPIYVVTPDD
jgi:hypothetical protein